jgi:hypothetical protein
MQKFIEMKYNKDKVIQARNNTSFELRFTKMIQVDIQGLCILHKIMEKYEDYLLFNCNFHNIFISPRVDPKVETRMLPFCIIEEDIQWVIIE